MNADDSPHQKLNPKSMARPSGYAHAVLAAQGRAVYLAGQTGHRPDGSIAEDLVEQFEDACSNVVTALAAAEGRPEELVSMQIFTTDLSGYVASSARIGEAYRKHFGRHFGANALIEVKGLMGGAKVELVCVAVVAGDRGRPTGG
jgi:enamine deaminase RidA (YjgF/YER057c/UK114 family)